MWPLGSQRRSPAHDTANTWLDPALMTARAVSTTGMRMLGSTAVLVPCTSSSAPGPLEHLTQSRCSLFWQLQRCTCWGSQFSQHACTRSSVPGARGCGCCRSAHAGMGDALHDQERVPTSWQGLMSLSKISAWSRARGKPSTWRAREQLGLVTRRCSTCAYVHGSSRLAQQLTRNL